MFQALALLLASDSFLPPIKFEQDTCPSEIASDVALLELHRLHGNICPGPESKILRQLAPEQQD